MRGRSNAASTPRILFALLLLGLLNGCSDGPDNDPPVADAGGDQNVTLGSLVSLNGSRSHDPDSDMLSFRWSFMSRPAGSRATLSNPTFTTPTFRADLVGMYEISLVVNDGKVDSMSDTVIITVGCNGNELFNNAEWVVARQAASIPEDPFQVIVDGNVCGMTKLLTFASRVDGTTRFPQVFVINSSGFLRIKAGADPSPPIPFGQSLVLGPAIFGTSASFPNTTLFFNPQLQTVSIDTSPLNPDGTGTLLIELIANDAGLPTSSTKTNQIMNLTWISCSASRPMPRHKLM
jgi:hypothetical protein